MSRLEEIKNEYAIELYPNHDYILDYKSFINFFANRHPEWFVSFNDEVAKRYAIEVAKASLRRADTKAMMRRVDKQSITNPDNIVLL